MQRRRALRSPLVRVRIGFQELLHGVNVRSLDSLHRLRRLEELRSLGLRGGGLFQLRHLASKSALGRERIVAVTVAAGGPAVPVVDPQLGVLIATDRPCAIDRILLGVEVAAGTASTAALHVPAALRVGHDMTGALRQPEYGGRSARRGERVFLPCRVSPGGGARREACRR